MGFQIPNLQHCNLKDGSISCPQGQFASDQLEYALIVYNPNLEDANHFSFKMDRTRLQMEMFQAKEKRLGF